MAEPWMTEPERERFSWLIQKANCYLEYGSGMSTVKAVELKIPNIVSVESDPLWIKKIQKQIDGLEYTGNCMLVKVDIGRTGKWGTPRTNIEWKNYWKYSIAIWDHLMLNNLPPDLILIDGRFRVACFLASLLYGMEGRKILFHDYVERSNYHVVENYLDPDKITGTMAEFTIPNVKAIEPEQIWRGLLIAVTDYR